MPQDLGTGVMTVTAGAISLIVDAHWDRLLEMLEARSVPGLDQGRNPREFLTWILVGFDRGVQDYPSEQQAFPNAAGELFWPSELRAEAQKCRFCLDGVI